MSHNACAYACVRVACCKCVTHHVILASISVSIAFRIKSLTPACQWRNPSSPERGRAGFDSPARRHGTHVILLLCAVHVPTYLRITNLASMCVVMYCTYVLCVIRVVRHVLLLLVLVMEVDCTVLCQSDILEVTVVEDL